MYDLTKYHRVETSKRSYYTSKVMRNPYLKDFLNKFAKKFDENGYSIKTLSDECGIAKSSLYGYINGTELIKVKNLKKLDKYLHFDKEFIDAWAKVISYSKFEQKYTDNKFVHFSYLLIKNRGLLFANTNKMGKLLGISCGAYNSYESTISFPVNKIFYRMLDLFGYDDEFFDVYYDCYLEKKKDINRFSKLLIEYRLRAKVTLLETAKIESRITHVENLKYKISLNRLNRILNFYDERARKSNLYDMYDFNSLRDEIYKEFIKINTNTK